MVAFFYVLGCADGSYYVCTTRGALENRLAEHNAGHYGGFTAKRRPGRLLFAQEFERITDAIAAERQVKGWRRAKKEALIRAEFELLRQLSRRGDRRASSPASALPRSSFETPPAAAPQDEGSFGSAGAR
jgi:putative endonuclease